MFSFSVLRSANLLAACDDLSESSKRSTLRHADPPALRFLGYGSVSLCLYDSVVYTLQQNQYDITR